MKTKKPAVIRLTEEEKRAAHVRGDFAALWPEADLIVQRTIKTMRQRKQIAEPAQQGAALKAFWDELLQVGRSAAWEAVRTWGNARFVRWIANTARWRMIDHLRGRKIDKAQRKINPEKIEELPDPNSEERKVFDGIHLTRMEFQVTARQVLAMLEPQEREVITRAFGIDCAEESQSETARRLGLSQPTVSRMFETAMSKMADYSRG